MGCISRWFSRVAVVCSVALLSGCGSGDEAVASSWSALLDDGDARALAPPQGGAFPEAPTRTCSDCADLPLAFWRFDDCNPRDAALADTAGTSSIAHPAFRAVSVACSAEARAGTAVALASKDDIVYAPDQPDFLFDQGLTVAMWVKPEAVRRTQSLIRKRLDGTSAFALAIDSGRVHFVVRLGSGRIAGVSAPLAAGAFSHVAASYDGKQLLLYLNGSLSARTKAVGKLARGSGPIFIGNDGDGRLFKGLLDEVWLNNLAASPDAIRGLNCVRKPPVVSFSPGESPPTSAGDTVSFDLAIENQNDPKFCPTDTFGYFAANVPPPLTTVDYFGELAVAPGTTGHASVHIASEDTDVSGSFGFDYIVFDEADNAQQATASASYVVVPPPPPMATGCPSAPNQPVAPGGYYVNGNSICTPDGRAHRFHGVDRPSLEWMSAGERLSLADFKLMAGWNANVVRIGLNQDFWLAGSALFDPGYAATIDAAIYWAEIAGMDVILDLHWSDAGVLGGCDPAQGCQQLMPDVNSKTFWAEVAARYKSDGRVMFELYNEPHDVSWEIWQHGGLTEQGFEAVGMQTLYDTVRATGAENLVLIGGLDWAYDLSGVPSHRIVGHNIVYSTHPYGPYRPIADFGRAFGALTRTDPVVATEFGMLNDTACTTDYATEVIDYVDRHLGGWTAWAWFPGGCTFPAIITDWTGSPSAIGAVVKARLASFDDPPASPPLPDPGLPDFAYAFDFGTQGWTLNDYADPTYTNLAVNPPSGTTPPSLGFSATNGNPNAGSLALEVSFSALDQYADAILNLGQPGVNLSGKTLHAFIRLVSGSFPAGGLQFHASTGASYTFGSTSWVSSSELPPGVWIPLSIDLGAVTASGYDPSQVVQIGIQIFSGFSNDGSSFENTGPVSFEIDTVTD